MRVAALQMTAGLHPGRNLDILARLAGKAAAAGATYALSPEMSIVFAENRAGLAAVAEPFKDNSALARCSEIARNTGLFLHLGSLAVALSDGHFANRSVLFRPDGSQAAIYDKIHLFDAQLEGLAVYRESAIYAAGDQAVVAAAGDLHVGLSICYDLRFPALYRALAEAGATVLAVPAAFTVPTGTAHWEVLLRARAIETGSFVIAAAQAGAHENGRTTYGHSMIVDPWGSVLGQLDGEGEGLLVCDLDLEIMRKARAALPVLAHGRSFSLSVNDRGAN